MCQLGRLKGTLAFVFILGGNCVGKVTREVRQHGVGFEVGPRHGAGCTAEAHCYICPFPLEIVASPLACVLVGRHKCVAGVQGASWDDKKRELGQAAARAS